MFLLCLTAIRARIVTTLSFVVMLFMSPWAALAGDAPNTSRWKLEADLFLDSGYNNNISISSYAKPGSAVGSATSNLGTSFGPQVRLAQPVTLSLSYALDQDIYWSQHQTDMQTHALELALRIGTSKWKSILRGGPSFLLHSSQEFSLYSIEEESFMELWRALINPLWIGVQYSFKHKGVLDDDYLHLRGQIHEVQLRSKLHLGESVILTGGYVFELVQLGTVTDELGGGGGSGGGSGGGATAQIVSPLSYRGHYLSARASFFVGENLLIIPRVQFGLKAFDEILLSGQSGGSSGGAGNQGSRLITSDRQDWMLRAGLFFSYDLTEKVSLDLNGALENSSSSLETRRVTGSYFTAFFTAGLSFMY